MARRLYVTGEGENLLYCTATCFEEAKQSLGDSCRTPDPDDLRIVWRLAKLDTLSGPELRAKLGVSRQTVDNWWRKAGGEGALPRRADQAARERVTKIQKALMKRPKVSATAVARKLNTTIHSVRQVASSIGVNLAGWRRRPSDEELVRLATGKTWQEFADAVGLKLGTLRTYIYARPELSEAIRKVRTAQPSGRTAHGKIEPEKIIQLHYEGHSAYKIAQILKVEQMSVRHWLKRKAQEVSDACANDSAAVAGTVAGSDGRAVSKS